MAYTFLSKFGVLLTAGYLLAPAAASSVDGSKISVINFKPTSYQITPLSEKKDQKLSPILQKGCGKECEASLWQLAVSCPTNYWNKGPNTVDLSQIIKLDIEAHNSSSGQINHANLGDAQTAEQKAFEVDNVYYQSRRNDVCLFERVPELYTSDLIDRATSVLLPSFLLTISYSFVVMALVASLYRFSFKGSNTQYYRTGMLLIFAIVTIVLLALLGMDLDADEARVGKEKSYKDTNFVRLRTYLVAIENGVSFYFLYAAIYIVGTYLLYRIGMVESASDNNNADVTATVGTVGTPLLQPGQLHNFRLTVPTTVLNNAPFYTAVPTEMDTAYVTNMRKKNNEKGEIVKHVSVYGQDVLWLMTVLFIYLFFACNNEPHVFAQAYLNEIVVILVTSLTVSCMAARMLLPIAYYAEEKNSDGKQSMYIGFLATLPFVLAFVLSLTCALVVQISRNFVEETYWLLQVVCWVNFFFQTLDLFVVMYWFSSTNATYIARGQSAWENLSFSKLVIAILFLLVTSIWLSAEVSYVTEDMSKDFISVKTGTSAQQIMTDYINAKMEFWFGNRFIHVPDNEKQHVCTFADMTYGMTSCRIGETAYKIGNYAA